MNNTTTAYETACQATELAQVRMEAHIAECSVCRSGDACAEADALQAAICACDTAAVGALNATVQPREDDGRYASGGSKTLCVCGHALGTHTAKHPRSCIAGDFSGVDCDCQKFKKARVAR